MNVILVSLPGEALQDQAAFLKAIYGVEAIAIEMDLCEEGSCRELLNQVIAYDVKVNMLINNAGVGGTDLFHCGCLSHYEKQIKLNVLATTITTHLFMAMLKENHPSYILNVGSLASFFSLPKKQVYGATKSFIWYFSKSLRREVKKDAVFISVLCPGGMYTNEAAKQSIENGTYLSRVSSMQPEEVAPIALTGLLQRKAVIIPGKINKTILFLKGLVPGFVVNYYEERTMKQLHTPTTQTPPKHVISLSSLQPANLKN
jgi:short-subunit dehydrogenase